MEHPGQLWNSIESAFNQLAGRLLPAAMLRWGWVLVHAALLCGTCLFLTLTTGVTAFFVTDSIWSALSEPVYTATPEIVTVDGIEYYIQNGAAIAVGVTDTTITEAVVPSTVNGYP